MLPDEAPSKTQRKKDMHALQDLGEELTRLSDPRLAELGLPDGLVTAIRDLRRITRHEARRRQMQYIGRLMRDVDPEPIRRRMEVWSGGAARETALLHRAEHWRDQLLADDGALEAFAREHPGADLPQLRTLVRNARKERAAESPPKSARALFRALRETLAQGTPAAAPAEPEDGSDGT